MTTSPALSARVMDEIERKLQHLKQARDHRDYSTELGCYMKGVPEAETAEADLIATIRAALDDKAVPDAVPPTPSRQDADLTEARRIISEVNEVARVILRRVRGFGVPAEFLFYMNLDSSRARQAWETAAEVYELVTDCEVREALRVVLGLQR